VSEGGEDALRREVEDLRRRLQEVEESLRSRTPDRDRSDLEAARKAVAAANQAKDEFLAVLSHELRTPLNAILGWVYLLKSGNLPPEEIAAAIDVIERSAKAQSQLIDDLLDMSRIISGKIRLNLEVVPIDRAIDAALGALRTVTGDKKIRIERRVDPEAAAVLGDAARLQQVAWNLLSNAVKFTPPGGQVEIRVERSGARVRFTVRDTGIGIRPEFLPHVFDRFRQADSSTTRRQGGLGLGLSIVRHMVELHGGTVEAESEGEGKGASFTATFPAPPAWAGQPAPAPASPAPAGPPSAAAPPEAPVDLAGARVLMVDDDPDSCEVVRKILEGRGARVETALSSAEAVGKVRGFRPDVILSDIAMPGEDGCTFLARASREARDIGIDLRAVALTAFARDEDRDRILASGFHLHLAKPVEAGELIRAVARLLGREPGRSAEREMERNRS
jgi:signal transduction histidine kinase/ActR/RegA family two-component response regulator